MMEQYYSSSLMKLDGRRWSNILYLIFKKAVNQVDWRLLDLKGLPGIRTQSIWHALALVQNEQYLPNTLIISWPKSPVVCVGLHQIVDLSIEKEYVSKKNLEVVRRAGGGGSVPHQGAPTEA